MTAARWWATRIAAFFAAWLFVVVSVEAVNFSGVVQPIVPYLVSFISSTTPQLVVGNGTTSVSQCVKFDGGESSDPQLCEDHTYTTALSLENAGAFDLVGAGIPLNFVNVSNQTVNGSIKVPTSGGDANVMLMTNNYVIADSTNAVFTAGLGVRNTSFGSILTARRPTETEITLPTSGGNTTTANVIPAGCFLASLTGRVTSVITGPTTLQIDDGVTAGLFATSVGVALNSTFTSANAIGNYTPKVYPAASGVTVRPIGANFSGSAGKIRFAAHCLDGTAPTS